MRIYLKEDIVHDILMKAQRENISSTQLIIKVIEYYISKKGAKK